MDELTCDTESGYKYKRTKLKRQTLIVNGGYSQNERWRIFWNWLTQRGAKFPKGYVKFYDSECSAIHATTRIEQDEDFMYIPLDCIMTTDLAKSSDIGQKLISSKIDLRSKHSYLAAYLLQEREKESKSRWYPYMAVLPRSFDTVPLFFNENLRKELIGSMSIKKIDDRLESLRLEYESICHGIPEFNRFSLDDFMWARLVVITRIFGLVIDDIKTDGLVPMSDMLQHKRPRESRWTYSQRKGGFLMTTLQAIPTDGVISYSYGRKCNSRFFVNYGFVLEVNTDLDNEAVMKFELAKNDPQYAIKARHLGFNGHSYHNSWGYNDNKVEKSFQIPIQYKQRKVKEAFSFLRVLHAQGNEFLIISSSNGLRMEDIPPLSIRNERDVLISFAKSATTSLNKFEDPYKSERVMSIGKDLYVELLIYGYIRNVEEKLLLYMNIPMEVIKIIHNLHGFVTTLEYDNILLQNEEKYPKFSNERNCILMRRGEKEVLTFYVDLMEICVELFEMKYKDLKDKLLKDDRFMDDGSPLMQYINQVVVPLVQRFEEKDEQDEEDEENEENDENEEYEEENIFYEMNQANEDNQNIDYVPMTGIDEFEGF